MADIVLSSNTSEEANTNSELCALCGGACCKRSGCHFSPEEFSSHSVKGLKEYLDQGYISIDIVGRGYAGLNNDILFLRMRNKDEKIYDIYNQQESLGCALLTPTGCLLSYNERPRGGQLLVPYHKHECRNSYPIFQCALDWARYQGTLQQLASYYSQAEKKMEYENQLVKRITR